MQNAVKVTLAENLGYADFPTTGTFAHSRVLDLRCESDGSARPIEEAVLKRMRNHFVDYEQLPMIMSEAGPCQDVHLCELVRERDEQTLLLTDDISQVATLLGLFEVPFESNVFYVVETDVGKARKSAPAAIAGEPAKVSLTA